MITNELLEDFILTCNSCPKLCNRNPYPFPAYYEGSYQKQFMILGQSPGVEHVYPTLNQKEYLELYKTNFKRCNFFSYLNKIGIRSDSYYFTNIIKCPLRPGEQVEKDWISNCSRYLDLQFQLVKPSIVLVLSKVAGEYLGLTARHRILDCQVKDVSFKCLYSYHPSYVNQLFKDDREEYIEELRVILRSVGVL